MFSVYADSLGGTKKQEDIDLSRIMSEKTDLVRKMVSSIVGERAEINVER